MVRDIITGLIVVVLGAGVLALLGWLWRGGGMGRIRAAARAFREAPTSEARSAAHPDWTEPDELRDYLQSIKRVMEEEGFGSESPAPSPAPEPSGHAPASTQEERDALLKRGHDLLANMATSYSLNRFGIVSPRVMGYPYAIAFVRDGQELLSRVFPRRAQPELITSYKTLEEARHAIEETLRALGNIGHKVAPADE